jgi:hypothetical protein
VREILTHSGMKCQIHLDENSENFSELAKAPKNLATAMEVSDGRVVDGGKWTSRYLTRRSSFSGANRYNSTFKSLAFSSYPFGNAFLFRISEVARTLIHQCRNCEAKCYPSQPCFEVSLDFIRECSPVYCCTSCGHQTYWHI